MPQNLSLITLTGIFSLISNFSLIVKAQNANLFLAYPPNNHETTANSIFLIGSAPNNAEVLINGKKIQRSQSGNFAPSFPLNLGENKFTIRYRNQQINRTINRLSIKPQLPQGLGFAENSLTPQHNMARLPNELICFSAIAPPQATVFVELAKQQISLLPSSQTINLPPNSAVLISENAPIIFEQIEDDNNLNYQKPSKLQNDNSKIKLAKSNVWQTFQGCTSFRQEGFMGNPIFFLNHQGKTTKKQSSAEITILSPNNLKLIEVITDNGVARTGPSTNYSRLTPLPKSTRATVTGREGEWLRLNYGGWIKANETRMLPYNASQTTLIRSITSRQVNNATEIIFPLQHPVPITIKQENNRLSLSLYNITAQTDTIRFDDNPFIQRLDWYQVNPTQVEYIFNLKSEQQWGYDVYYEGTSLILSLRHPPKKQNSLEGITILLDPGHGGEELGAVGPNGYPEKDVNLIIAKILQQKLTQRGAKVVLTRESDQYVSLANRVNLINKIKPTLAFSIHYNALPDGGDAIKTKGVSTFWYHPQAHDLAVFLHNYLVKNLNRPSYGVFWNNLALTRPHTAPTVLLELGFMINPDEFEWIINPNEQQRLTDAIANGITEWLIKNNN